MRYWVGFDVGKAFHWLCVLDEEGEEVLSRRIEATEEDLEASCSELERLGGECTVGIDLLGGPATLLEAVLLGRSQRLFHVPGIAVNRARDAYPGEAKSDSKDAHVIADQLRLRHASLHEVCPRDETIAEMRLLVSHRRDLLQDQTRRAARLREVLLGVFPGLEAALDLKREGALVAVTKVATPSAARKLGVARLFRWLKARDVRKAEALAKRIVEAAKAQRRELPAAEVKGALVAEIACEMLRTRERIAELDRHLEELLANDPAARIVRTMPGMGVVFTAEFLAEVGDLLGGSSRPTPLPPPQASLPCSGPREPRATEGERDAATRCSSAFCTARPSVASLTTSVARLSTGRSGPRARATTRR